jgi:hypothetical protein
MFILFGICGVAYPTLTASDAGYRAFQVFFCCFFGCCFVLREVFFGAGVDML